MIIIYVCYIHIYEAAGQSNIYVVVAHKNVAFVKKKGLSMSTYLLIHGDWHGGWCWNRIAPLLRQAGHHVLAPDLPGHGQDRTPLSALTPQSSLHFLLELLDAQDEQVILVGHSSGGVLLTLLAEQRPEKIKLLVYLSAFLLPPGVWPRALAGQDTESLLPSALLVDQERRVVTVKPEAAREVFYADCTDEDAAWATSLLVPEPLRMKAPEEMPPQSMPANIPEISLPKVYISCLQDRALGPLLQQKMYTATPCQKVYTLPTSHSPFLSAPDQLAACLLDLT
jgi:pimeloyl-ACP methyl ester carboxylesterase